MQAYNRRPARAVINGHDIEPAGTLADVTFRQKSLRSANHQVLFFPCNAQFGQGRQVLPDRARSDFDKCQRLVIVTYEIDFSLDAARSVIPGYEYVPLPPQIPVGIGFTANAGAPSLQLFSHRWKNFLLLASPAVPPNAPRETSVVKISAWFRHRFHRAFRAV
jgi:hypothetical protein